MVKERNWSTGLVAAFVALFSSFSLSIGQQAAAAEPQVKQIDYSQDKKAVGTQPMRILLMPNAQSQLSEVQTSLAEILGAAGENGKITQVIGSGQMTTFVIELNPAHAEEVKTKLRKDSKHFGAMQQSRTYRMQVSSSSKPLFNDQLFRYQRHLQTAQVNQALDKLGLDSPHGVILGIADTGIDSANADLPASKVVRRVDCSGTSARENSRDKDVQGHGTAMASTAAAVGNNLTLGASPGYDIRIVGLRVADATGAMADEYLINSLQYAGTHNIKVVNWSLNAPPPYTISNSHLYSPVLYTWMNWYANAPDSCRGLIINSSGNENLKDSADRVYTPYLVVIGASNYDDSRAYFSNYGPRVDIAAPGVDILTSLRGGEYNLVSGTSPAAALVSGIVAKVWSQYPRLTNIQMRDVLIKTARRTNKSKGSMGSGVVAMNSLLEELKKRSNK